MRTLACLLLALPLTANACDWHVTRDRTDPMTGQRECTIQSHGALIGVGVYGDRVEIAASSQSYLPDLSIRIDDNPAIFLGSRDNGANIRLALEQIRSGHRIRTSFRDYPQHREGEAEICTLPALIRSCQSSR